MATKIVNVIVDESTAHVTYSTGSVKKYPADKLPKTVRTWLDENSRKDPEMIQDFVQTTFPELFQPVDEWLQDKSTQESGEPAQEPTEPAQEASEDAQTVSDASGVELARVQPRRACRRPETPIAVPGGIPGSPLPMIQAAGLMAAAGACLLGAVVIRAVTWAAELLKPVVTWPAAAPAKAILTGQGA